MTGYTPKAIDTHYNGYKFRSRTEARWAVFFDELHIAYDYESQGFELNGVRYLPDFHLTNGLILHKFEPTQPDHVWVEIKPNPDLDESERFKIAEFVKQTDHHILLIAGQPDVNTTLRFIDHHPKTGWLVTDVRWIELEDGQIGVVPIENLNNGELLKQTNTPRLRHALDKARQSRFEFGQTPTPQTAPSDKKRETSQQIWSKAKTCESCGKEFNPYRQHFMYCASCYHKQKKEQETTQIPSIPATVSPAKAKKEKSPQKKKYGMAFIVGIFIILCFGGLMFVNQAMLGNRASSLDVPIPTTTSGVPATFTPLSTRTVSPTQTPVPSATANAVVCTCARNTYDCADFTTQSEAQACFDYCFESAGDIHFLDNNDDGKACESLP